MAEEDKNASSIYIIKLNPGSDILRWTNKEMKNKFDELPLRFKKSLIGSKFDDVQNNPEELVKELKNKIKVIKNNPEESATEFCKKHKIAGIGWSLKPIEEPLSIASFDDYCTAIKAKDTKPEWYKSRVPSSVKHISEIEEGDIIWIRDNSDAYYIGSVVKPWEYKDDPDYWARDLVNLVTVDRWRKIGDYTESPGEVVRKLISQGHAVQKMENDLITSISEKLIKNPGFISDCADKFNESKRNLPENWIEHIDEYTFEDIVGFYLQKEKGYILMPSSRLQSTKGYEFVAIEPERGGKVAVQVKYKNYDKEEFDKQYKKLEENYKLYVAYRWKDEEELKKFEEDYSNKSNGKIIPIKIEELRGFLNKNSGLLTKWMKFLIARKD